MQDEQSTPQEEEEVEGHVTPRTGPEDPTEGANLAEGEEDEDVEAHVRPQTGPPEKRFKRF
jgi:hypothetical protein